MNKTLIAAAVMATSAFSSSTLAHAGTVNFTGEILPTGCEVTTATNNQNVDLGRIWVNELLGSTKSSSPQGFDLKLENCPTSVSTAVVRFDGTQVPGNSASLLALTEEPDVAEGVAVQIKDINDNEINLFENSTDYTLLPAPEVNVLKFKANYYAFGTPTAGKANAVANFSIIYR